MCRERSKYRGTVENSSRATIRAQRRRSEILTGGTPLTHLLLSAVYLTTRERKRERESRTAPCVSRAWPLRLRRKMRDCGKRSIIYSQQVSLYPLSFAVSHLPATLNLHIYSSLTSWLATRPRISSDTSAKQIPLFFISCISVNTCTRNACFSIKTPRLLRK